METLQELETLLRLGLGIPSSLPSEPIWSFSALPAATGMTGGGGLPHIIIAVGQNEIKTIRFWKSLSVVLHELHTHIYPAFSLLAFGLRCPILAASHSNFLQQKEWKQYKVLESKSWKKLHKSEFNNSEFKIIICFRGKMQKQKASFAMCGFPFSTVFLFDR